MDSDINYKCKSSFRRFTSPLSPSRERKHMETACISSIRESWSFQHKRSLHPSTSKQSLNINKERRKSIIWKQSRANLYCKAKSRWICTNYEWWHFISLVAIKPISVKQYIRLLDTDVWPRACNWIRKCKIYRKF